VLSRQVGWRTNEAVQQFNLGQCALERGDVAAALARADAAFALAEAAEDRSHIARIFMLRGDAQALAGDRQAALAAYEESRVRYERLSNAPFVVIISAVIAECCLAAGDAARALTEADRTLRSLEGGVSLSGSGEEVRVRWLCFKVLDAAGDARASPHLEALHTDLQAIAANIADAATRQQFLGRAGSNRDVVAAWQARRVP
jgi:ATP/maltotriose-dependent transcriptional regulator MalT